MGYPAVEPRPVVDGLVQLFAGFVVILHTDRVKPHLRRYLAVEGFCFEFIDERDDGKPSVGSQGNRAGLGLLKASIGVSKIRQEALHLLGATELKLLLLK